MLTRSIVVTEPNQGRQIFAFFHQCTWMPWDPPATAVPTAPANHTQSGGGIGTRTRTITYGSDGMDPTPL